MIGDLVVVALMLAGIVGARRLARRYGRWVAARLAAERDEDREFWAWVDVMRTPL